MTAKLPAVGFERGMCLRQKQLRMGDVRETSAYLLIGRIEGTTPFLLSYSGLGIANWWCAERLGESLRRKILQLLRTEVRYASTLPAYLTERDLRELDERDASQGLAQAEALWFGFFNEQWRAQTLGERDDDWLELDVPFADKDQAKAAGAKWDGQKRRWLAKRQPDMTVFSRWMPAADQAS